VHAAAGPGLLRACRQLPEVEPGVRVRTGGAVLLPGFGLHARYVIAAVGPRFRSEKVSAPLLASAYRSALKIASREPEIESVALPALSCGVYGYPTKDALKIAVGVISDMAAGEGKLDLHAVHMVMFSSKMLKTCKEVADEAGLVRVQPSADIDPQSSDKPA
jgi:O-acetyl-ADP-ribose deacetylase